MPELIPLELYSAVSEEGVTVTALPANHGTRAELDATLPSPLRAAHDGLEVVFTLP